MIEQKSGESGSGSEKHLIGDSFNVAGSADLGNKRHLSSSRLETSTI